MGKARGEKGGMEEGGKEIREWRCHLSSKMNDFQVRSHIEYDSRLNLSIIHPFFVPAYWSRDLALTNYERRDFKQHLPISLWTRLPVIMEMHSCICSKQTHESEDKQDGEGLRKQGKNKFFFMYLHTHLTLTSFAIKPNILSLYVDNSLLFVVSLFNNYSSY